MDKKREGSSGFLFDTSSLLYVLKARQYQRLNKKSCNILDLTFYEYGNAVLNILTKRGSGKDLPSTAAIEEGIKILLQAYEKTTEQVTVRVCNDRGSSSNNYSVSISDIFELAKKEKLTFYDASYLYYCLAHDLSFVTEDKPLAAAAQRNSINAMDADRWSKLV